MVGESAGQQAYNASIRVLVMSREQVRASNTMRQLLSSTSIFTDEYSNKLDNPQLEDAFAWVFDPLRRFAYSCRLLGFFQSKNIYSIDEMSTMYHFPDITYNKAPIISWM